jgi:cobyrinic acid a,c-diamide synthase
LANRVGSEGHAQMLRESLRPGMRWFGALPGDEQMSMPSRHLGLVQAGEVADLDARLDRAADALGRLHPELPQEVWFDHPGDDAVCLKAGEGTDLKGVTIAVARDAAFAFIYHANLDTLRELGAELVFFSPLRDGALPDAHALYLPGGYPELHARRLSDNPGMKAAVRAHHAQGKPIVAECGGMLALMDSLTDLEGQVWPMWALLEGQGVMTSRLVNLGMHHVEMPQGHVRGHTFHHGSVTTPMTPWSYTHAQRFNGQPEAVYRRGGLHASFFHHYFASNPAATAALFRP